MFGSCATSHRREKTFIIVVHVNKQSGVYGRKRIADSSDIWDASRSVLMLGETQEKGVRYLTQEKSNYGKLEKTALYTLNDKGIPIFKTYTDKKDRDYVMAESRERTVIDAGYIGMYNRYDKVPKEVWSAHVYTVGAEAEDVLSVMIEDEK